MLSVYLCVLGCEGWGSIFRSEQMIRGMRAMIYVCWSSLILKQLFCGIIHVCGTSKYNVTFSMCAAVTVYVYVWVSGFISTRERNWQVIKSWEMRRSATRCFCRHQSSLVHNKRLEYSRRAWALSVLWYLLTQKPSVCVKCCLCNQNEHAILCCLS